MKSFIARLLIALTLAGLPSCTVGTLVPEHHSMPAARAALDPEVRIFYDSLEEYGDWKLIEPLGYVFRPRLNFTTWRPYTQGFWSPNDAYGWVWVSGDNFGWATDHYGRWAYDRFDGWVWMPGADWAPAWVTWETNDDYVGWAPVLAGGGGNVPGGAYVYAATRELASPDLESRTVPAATARAAGPMERIDRTERIEGVVVPAGPRIEWVEQRAGALRRVRLVDGVTPGGGLPRTTGAAAPAVGGERPSTIPAAPADSTRRAGAMATRDARRALETGAVPDRVILVRPLAPAALPAPPPAKKRAAPAPARPDTTH